MTRLSHLVVIVSLVLALVVAPVLAVSFGFGLLSPDQGDNAIAGMTWAGDCGSNPYANCTDGMTWAG